MCETFLLSLFREDQAASLVCCHGLTFFIFFWIVLVEKHGGKEGEMEEWDLVEELFNRIREPEEEEEDEDEDEE